MQNFSWDLPIHLFLLHTTIRISIRARKPVRFVPIPQEFVVQCFLHFSPLHFLAFPFHLAITHIGRFHFSFGDLILVGNGIHVDHFEMTKALQAAYYFSCDVLDSLIGRQWSGGEGNYR
jgi:hypothetical protein